MALDLLYRAFNIPTAKKENERIVAIFERKKALEQKRDAYRQGIINRQANAKTYVNEGHMKLGRNELFMVRVYRKDLDMVADLLLNIERLVAGRERAELLKKGSAMTKDVLVWLKQTVDSMGEETPSDQAREMDTLLQKINRVQAQFNQSNEQTIEQTLTVEEAKEIEEELEDMIEYDDTDDADGTGIYRDADDDETMKIILPRQKPALLIADDASS